MNVSGVLMEVCGDATIYRICVIVVAVVVLVVIWALWSVNVQGP